MRQRNGERKKKEKKKKSCTACLGGHLKILAALEKCLLSSGTALKWSIPEGKESHFVCITLKRSQEEQTGMREPENHQETGGLRRRSEREEAERAAVPMP